MIIKSPRWPQLLYSLPADGVPGQLLTKSSGADYDTQWSSAAGAGVASSGMHVIMGSGTWHSPCAVPVKGTGSYTLNSGSSVYLPFWLDTAVSVDTVACWLKTVAISGTLNFALLSHNSSTNAPGTWLATGSAGFSPTVGRYMASVSAGLSAGWNWMGVGLDGGAGTSVVLSAASPTRCLRSPLVLSTIPQQTYPSYLVLAGDFTVPAAPAATANTVQLVPQLWFRIA